MLRIYLPSLPPSLPPSLFLHTLVNPSPLPLREGVQHGKEVCTAAAPSPSHGLFATAACYRALMCTVLLLSPLCLVLAEVFLCASRCVRGVRTRPTSSPSLPCSAASRILRFSTYTRLRASLVAVASREKREASSMMPAPDDAATPTTAAARFTAEDPNASTTTIPAVEASAAATHAQVHLNAKVFMVNLGQDVQTTVLGRFRNLQGTIHSQLRNLQNNVANLRHSTGIPPEALHSRWVYHYNHSALGIHSLRKLFDVIEQRYSHVSILLLLCNVGLEAAAFGIYLHVQNGHVTEDWREFDWGLGYFIAEVLLSVVFMASWISLLAVEAKKWNYVLNARSLMNYLSSGWMLLLALGALLTLDRAWTHVYAPMFLRVWWLHESLLSLLNYPQISVYFTENRLEMVRSMIQCIAVVGISVGILQAVESFCGDPVEYFDMVYMMLLSFSSIGYGDVTPLTVQGRLLMIIFIGVGFSYFVPILQYVADLGVYHLSYAYYTTCFKRTDHVVICGHLGYNELRMQLKNVFAEDRHYLNMSVVLLLREQPSAQVLLLLNSPKYRSAVHLLVGDPGVPTDLDRCNARGASAMFLLGAGTNSSYYSDYDLAAQTMTVNALVPDLPLYILLHRSRYTKSLMPSRAIVLEFERLNHNLLGLGCVLPGIIPLVANLMRMFDPMTTEALWELRDFKDLLGLSGSAASLRAMRKMWAPKRPMLTYGSATIELGLGAEPDWMSTYEASLAQHVDTVAAPPPVQRGHYTVVRLARLLYRTDITLIGVVRSSGSGDSVVELAPRGSLVGVKKLIVICDVRRAAQDIVDEIVNDATRGSTSSAAAGAPAIRPPPPAGVQATAVTVVPIPAREDAGAVWNSSATTTTIAPTSRASQTSLKPAAAPAPAPAPAPATATAATVIGASAVELPRRPHRVACERAAEARMPHNDSSLVLSAAIATEDDDKNDDNEDALIGALASPVLLDAVGRGRPACMGARVGAPATVSPSSPVVAASRSVLRVEPDVRHLANHYVFIDLSSAHERTNWSREAAVESRTAKAADYYDIMRPVRQHDPDSNIVLLANDTNYDSLNNMWEEEDVTGSLIVVQGCGLFTSDLRRCNVAKAAAVVIFSAGDRCDEHGDSLSVLVMQLVRQLISEDKHGSAADIPIVVEVDHAELVPLFAPAMTVGKDVKTAEWVLEPSFMSGCVVCRHMLDTGLQEMYFTPELHDVLEQLLSSKSESLLVTVMAPDAAWTVYEDATSFGVDNGLLPLAIHRFHEMIRDDTSVSFRYIITNPPPSFPLHPDDFIYCLKLCDP
ncbi:potassium channel subunit-like protein [Leishmania infantum JPCM5]|uniref:Potassium channel subunit-like protein n=2 Tax=Leishmania infantum TaxID=5671 RepID=A4HRK5_LEIIN|nr:potassium channel subunit-like protein [Leishmania infantum JPCM5]CAM65235.1 potassium channel subunit-like protein [Leishmania infantum JPCM5]|eukprot:XP_001462697.1 potassium channel subunit-like protein [Leishmania infantum JPCM5]